MLSVFVVCTLQHLIWKEEDQSFAVKHKCPHLNSFYGHQAVYVRSKQEILLFGLGDYDTVWCWDMISKGCIHIHSRHRHSDSAFNKSVIKNDFENPALHICSRNMKEKVKPLFILNCK